MHRKRVGQAIAPWRIERSVSVPSLSRSIAFSQEISGDQVNVDISVDIAPSTLILRYNSLNDWMVSGLNATIAINVTGAYNVTIDEQIDDGAAIYKGDTLYLQSAGENVLVLTFGAENVEVDAGFLSVTIPYAAIQELLRRLLNSVGTEWIRENVLSLAAFWVPYLRELYDQNADRFASYIAQYRGFFLDLFNTISMDSRFRNVYAAVLPLLRDPEVLRLIPEVRSLVGRRSDMLV